MNKERYIKQIRLNGIGEEGQQKIAQASVLVIGAGGLGCPVIQYLSAAGIGKLGIVDYDRVSESNLHRQILYTGNDIGKLKTEVAAIKAKSFHPEIIVETYNVKAGKENLLHLIKDYDLIVDACDSVTLRYQLSDACEILSKPIVYGAIFEFEGQVGMFGKTSDGKHLGYRDLFPYHEKMNYISDCNSNGVLPVLPGVIGLYQANEALKYIVNHGECLMHQVLMVDLLKNTSVTFQLSASNDLRPKNEKEFEAWVYETMACVVNEIIQADKHLFEGLSADQNLMIVDVRELSEQPRINKKNLITIPLSQLAEQENKLNEYAELMFICQSGKRSMQAAQWYFKKTT